MNYIFASFNVPLYHTLDTSYVQGDRGKQYCHMGSTITTTQECKVACDKLGKKVVTGHDGKPCYIAGNGRCKQDGKQNPRAHLVCKDLGILIIYIYQILVQISVYYQILDHKINYCTRDNLRTRKQGK